MLHSKNANATVGRCERARSESVGPRLAGSNQAYWNSVFRLQARDPQLEKVLEANKEVFEEGPLQGTEAKIYVDPSAQPKFVKARPVTYSLKAKIELELDRLEREGIISPVEFSEWAAPIVPVVKPNGTVRICGDYKCTANQVSKPQNGRPPGDTGRWKHVHETGYVAGLSTAALGQ